MATLVIEQPNYLPWMGFFDLLDQSDLWVWLDDVQYTRRDWRSRNRVAARDGAPRWLTVPVRSTGRREQRICEAEIDYGQDWVQKHLDTLVHCYRKAPHFPEVFALVEARLRSRPGHLADLTIPLCEDLARLLELHTDFSRSSQFAQVSGQKQARLLSIREQVGGEVYLSGPKAENYIDPAEFQAAGLELRYIEYGYADYVRGPGVPSPGLSVLDPLMWIGAEATREHWRRSASFRRG